jgi:iron complex transport system substrate-binding protein
MNKSSMNQFPGAYPHRIVCLQPSATVILSELGLLDRVVACTRYCKDVCPEVEGKTTIVADSWSAQAEQIRAARPDLVIAAVPYQLEAVGEILKSGTRFLGLAPRTLADIYTDIATIAGVLGACDAGQAVIAHMQGEIGAASQRNQGRPRPLVFCEEWGKPIIHSQAWVAELVAAAGGEFLGQPGCKTDPQTVCSADPEIMILAWCGAGHRVPLEKVVRERGWKETRAARGRNVYCISDELLNTPAPTLLDGLKALEAAIHPEAHGSLPPRLRRIAE